MLIHDIWNIYRYGERFKIVYIKAGYRSDPGKKRLRTLDEDTERFYQSIARAKARVLELALCNEFTHFCTFTQSDILRNDRFNLPDFRKDLAQFVRNRNRSRTPERQLRYLLVPEQHKDGAWHMHGLLSGLDALDLKPNEHGYLDWNAYRSRFGWFSVSDIKDPTGCAHYITKYISKSMAASDAMKKGQHLYFASQCLKGRDVICYEMKDPCPYDLDTFDFENDYVKVKWVDKL